MIAVSRMPADGADGDFVRSFKRRTQVFMLSKLAERLASTEILEAPEFEVTLVTTLSVYVVFRRSCSRLCRTIRCRAPKKFSQCLSRTEPRVALSTHNAVHLFLSD